MTERNIILSEMDGVISDDRWRKSFLDAEGWDEYYKPMNLDSPFRDTVEVLRGFTYDAANELYVLTSRPEKFRQMTIGWFAKHNIEPDLLIMRPDNCFEKATLVKLKQLELELGEGFTHRILASVDHNLNWLEKMRELNITTIEITHRGEQ